MAAQLSQLLSQEMGKDIRRATGEVEGGDLMVAGTPEEVAAREASATAKYLAEGLGHGV